MRYRGRGEHNIKELEDIIEYLDEQRKRESALSGGLASLVRLKPQISDIEHGPEPSIKELIMSYYVAHNMDHPEQLTSYYLTELENMAG